MPIAIALSIAYYLAHNLDKWSGTVKIIFQPAEEGPGGAKPMIEEGVLSNPVRLPLVLAKFHFSLTFR